MSTISNSSKTNIMYYYYFFFRSNRATGILYCLFVPFVLHFGEENSKRIKSRTKPFCISTTATTTTTMPARSAEKNGKWTHHRHLWRAENGALLARNNKVMSKHRAIVHLIGYLLSHVHFGGRMGSTCVVTFTADMSRTCISNSVLQTGAFSRCRSEFYSCFGAI